MTKFIDRNKVNKKVKPTIFTRCINERFNVIETNTNGNDFDYVEFIGRDLRYGDTFKAWNNGAETNFTLYFGIKGEEQYVNK